MHFWTKKEISLTYLLNLCPLGLKEQCIVLDWHLKRFKACVSPCGRGWVKLKNSFKCAIGWVWLLQQILRMIILLISEQQLINPNLQI